MVEEIPRQHNMEAVVWFRLTRSAESSRWSTKRREARSVAGKESKLQVVDRAEAP